MGNFQHNQYVQRMLRECLTYILSMLFQLFMFLMDITEKSYLSILAKPWRQGYSSTVVTVGLGKSNCLIEENHRNKFVKNVFINWLKYCLACHLLCAQSLNSLEKWKVCTQLYLANILNTVMLNIRIYCDILYEKVGFSHN